jgi:hypothetical protein
MFSQLNAALLKCTLASRCQAQGTLFTLESERLASGEPLRIQWPSGTTTHRIVKKH